MLLNQHGLECDMRRIRTDQGGELAKSSTYCNLIQKHNHILETTGSDKSFQKALTERPHRAYGEIMRTMVQGAGLRNTYWNYVLLHTVYLKNRLTHAASKATQYENYTGMKPYLSHLRIFWNFFTSKNPSDRNNRSARNVSHGIFLGYTATDRNIIFRDENSNQIRRAQHVVFDKIHYSRQKELPYAKQLYNFIDNSDGPPPIETLPLLQDDNSTSSITEFPDLLTPVSVTPNSTNNTPSSPLYVGIITIPNDDGIEAVDITTPKKIPQYTMIRNLTT